MIITSEIAPFLQNQFSQKLIWDWFLNQFLNFAQQIKSYFKAISIVYDVYL